MASKAETAAKVEVTIRHLQAKGDHELTVRVPASASLGEVRSEVARRLLSEKVLQKSGFVRSLANGTTQALKDSQPLGERRILLITGPRLGTPPPKRPTLDLFDASTPPAFQKIDSPRSHRACELEGITGDDLVYQPIEAFLDWEVPGYIAQLRHDFFEVLRQDFLAAVRRTRAILTAEEDGTAATVEDQSACTALAGNWGGALADSAYPELEKFMLDQRRLYEDERSNALRAPSKDVHGPSGNNGLFYNNPGGAIHGQSRYGTAAPPSVPFEKKAPHAYGKLYKPHSFIAGDTSNEEGSAHRGANRLNKLCQKLQHMPGSHKFVQGDQGEQVLRCHDQMLNTESTVVTQRRQNSLSLADRASEDQRLMSTRCQTEEKKMRDRDKEMAYIQWKRECMEERSEKSDKPKSKMGLQNLRSYSKNGMSGDERKKWHKYVQEKNHYNQVQQELQRIEKRGGCLAQSADGDFKVHEMWDNVKVAHATKWTERRVRWTAANKRVSDLNADWVQATRDRIQFVEDCRAGANDRQQKVRYYVKELKHLRSLFKDLANDRNCRRQAVRKKAIKAEIATMLEERRQDEAKQILSADSSTSSNFNFGSTTQSWKSSRERVSMYPLSHSRPRGVPRFDFPRSETNLFSLSATSLSKSNTLQASTSAPTLAAAMDV